MSMTTRQHQDMARRVNVSTQTLRVWKISPDTPADEVRERLAIKAGKLDDQIARLMEIAAGVDGELERMANVAEVGEVTQYNADSYKVVA